jgi:hypothetical protein
VCDKAKQDTEREREIEEEIHIYMSVVVIREFSFVFPPIPPSTHPPIHPSRHPPIPPPTHPPIPYTHPQTMVKSMAPPATATSSPRLQWVPEGWVEREGKG